MEGYIDTGKRDGCKATLERDVSLLGLLLLRLLEARLDNLTEHLLHLVDGELLGQLEPGVNIQSTESKHPTYLGNVDLLHLQVVQNVRQRLQRHKLSSANVLLTLN